MIAPGDIWRMLTDFTAVCTADFGLIIPDDGIPGLTRPFDMPVAAYARDPYVDLDKLTIALELAPRELHGQRITFEFELSREMLVDEDGAGIAHCLSTVLDTIRETINMRSLEGVVRGRGPEWHDRPPDLMTKVIGFRQWTVLHGRLLPFGRYPHRPIAPGQPGQWNGSEPVQAVCTVKDHAAPAPAPCHCGWNAYCRFDWKTHALSSPSRSVWGAMLAWGAIQTHAGGLYGAGFRSEWAQPIALAYDPRDRGSVEVEAISVPVAGTSRQVFRRGQEIRHPSDKETVTVIARANGLVAVPYERLVDYALEHGELLPNDLLPDDGWTAR
jgi:hypothetical protein